MQPRMNSRKAHLLRQIRAVKGNRLGYPRPPPRLAMNAAIFRPMTPRDNIRGLVGLFGPLAVHRDISSVLLGAVAVVLITGSHTIQQRNVNVEHGFIWTCRKTIKSFCFKFFSWLLWNRVPTAEKYTFLPIFQAGFCFIFHLQEDITALSNLALTHNLLSVFSPLSSLYAKLG